MAAVNLRDLAQPWGDSGAENGIQEFGEMAAGFTRLPAGFDSAGIMRAMIGEDFCPAPHWGFVISGAVGIRYADGHEEVARAGESFYMPPGHAPFSDGGAELVEFTPVGENAALMEKVSAFVAAQGNAAG